MLVNSNNSRLTSYRRLMLVAATISQTSAAFATQELAMLAGFLQKNLQLTTIQVALLFAASGLIPMLGILFVGDLLDQKLIRVQTPFSRVESYQGATHWDGFKPLTKVSITDRKSV